MADVDELDYDDPNQPTITEELLQIVEEFAEYIDKFMFEIVTFLAVIDSSMGLIKDVLAMFGFSGWKMTFFPTFSFIVTIGVFLFGTNKRKGKRKAEAAELEGLGQAMEMFDDVLGVVDDVLEEVEKVEGEAGGLGLGDYSDSDDDDNDENPNQTEIKEGGTTDVVVEIEVVQGEEAQEPQQQDTEPEAPPKSSIAKAIGMAVMVAGIAIKLAGKGKQQEPQQQENISESEPESELKKNAGDESQNNLAGSVTGAQIPPTDDKSKLKNDTCPNTQHDDTLGEIAEDLKQESIELAAAVKNDAIKATNIITDGTVDAGTIVHDNTKQVLTSTGALKVGHGLYREVDFISGHLKKEGIAAGNSIEKETLQVAKQVQGNKVVKETGVDKLGTGVYREAAFITTHVGKGTKDVLQHEHQKLAGSLGQTRATPAASSSGSEKESNSGQKGANTLLKNKGNQPQRPTNQSKSKTNTLPLTDNSQQRRQCDKTATEQRPPNQSQDKTKREATSSRSFDASNGHGLYREVDFKFGHVTREGIIKGKAIEPETTETVTSLKGSKVIYEPGQDSVVTGVYREAGFVTGLLSDETNKVIQSGEQELNPLCQPGPSGIVLEYTKTEDTNKNISELNQQEIKSLGIEENSKDPEHISSEPQTGVSNMAANVVDGAVGAAGSVASEAMNIDKKAEQGLNQAQKKSKGLLPIIMRLVRLIMRVVNKGKKSGSNSQASSRRGSTASAADSRGEPSKEKRTAEGGGDAANIAGAASSLAAGGGGGKGGKIGAIVGIVVRLVRLASKLIGGQKDAPSPSTRSNSTQSIDQQSDDEFFDCGEDFPTKEIDTQTDEMFLLSLATKTPSLDRPDTMDHCFDVDDDNDVLNEESLSKELKSIAFELQEVACENANSSLNGLADRIRAIGTDRTPLLDDFDDVTYDNENQLGSFGSPIEKSSAKSANDREPATQSITLGPSNAIRCSEKPANDREQATQPIILGPSNAITLQILPSSQMAGGNTEGTGTILIDFGSSVALRRTTETAKEQEKRSENNYNYNQNTVQTQNGNCSYTKADSGSYTDKSNEEELKELESETMGRHGQNMSQNQNLRASLKRTDCITYRDNSHQEDLESQINGRSSCSSPNNSPRGSSSFPDNKASGSQNSREVLVDIHTPRGERYEPEQTSYSRSPYSTSNNERLSPVQNPRAGSSGIVNDVNMRQQTQNDDHSDQQSYSTILTMNPLVAYDSSFEDLCQDNSVVYRRRPSVVRFEDECTSEDLHRERPLKPALKYRTTAEQERYQERDDRESVSYTYTFTSTQ